MLSVGVLTRYRHNEMLMRVGGAGLANAGGGRGIRCDVQSIWQHSRPAQTNALQNTMLITVQSKTV